MSILKSMITETAFIPAVQTLTTASGWVFGRKGEIVCEPDLEKIALLAKDQLTKAGLSCTVNLSTDTQFSADTQFFTDALPIRLRRDENVQHEEGYELTIDDLGVLIKARTDAGLFYGIQSFTQLVYSCNGRYPCLTIKDYPAFSWRGFMIDTSRTFYPVEFLKKMIDAAAFHKLNRFHWRLADDQGWRLSIDGYDKLTDMGGYYTKSDISNLVEYAAEHHVMVVPEIETPGYVRALLTSYPDFGCTGRPYEAEYHYGISDEVYAMLGKVFDTVCELFSSPYVHVGGDECFRTRLSCEDELQSLMTVKITTMLEERGKTAIGRDAVLDGTEVSLSKSLVVQSWRGMEGGKKALALGYKVIMSPEKTGCGLQYRPYDDPCEPGTDDVTTVKNSYDYSPVNDTMTQEEASYVLGGQGNLWTDSIYAPKIAEYMMFPRLCAIAESLWLNKDKKDFISFAKRLYTHKKRLDAMNILYYRGKLS